MVAPQCLEGLFFYLSGANQALANQTFCFLSVCVKRMFISAEKLSEYFLTANQLIKTCYEIKQFCCSLKADFRPLQKSGEALFLFFTLTNCWNIFADLAQLSLHHNYLIHRNLVSVNCMHCQCLSPITSAMKFVIGLHW